MPLTTGSGVVTPSRRQLEIAFDSAPIAGAAFPNTCCVSPKSSRDEFGRDIRELNTKLITTFLGPDLEGTLRAQLEELWGCPVYDNYGTNEFGPGAFECQHRNGLHLMEDAIYLEILDTETNEPVPLGKVGNLVVTAFHRQSCRRSATTCATSAALCRRRAATAAAASGAWTTSSAAATTW